MKKQLIIFFFLISIHSFSQPPIQWDFQYDASTENIVLTAKLDEGWHLYSQKIGANLGPIPTSFTFNENELVKLKGKTKEPEALSEFDENFGAELQYFEKSVSFTQKIRSNENTSITGTVTYMVCNATSCLPPVDETFEIQLFN